MGSASQGSRGSLLSGTALWHWESVGDKCLLLIAHYYVSVCSYFIYLLLGKLWPPLHPGEREIVQQC